MRRNAVDFQCSKSRNHIRPLDFALWFVGFSLIDFKMEASDCSKRYVLEKHFIGMPKEDDFRLVEDPLPKVLADGGIYDIWFLSRLLWSWSGVWPCLFEIWHRGGIPHFQTLFSRWSLCVFHNIKQERAYIDPSFRMDLCTNSSVILKRFNLTHV